MNKRRQRAPAGCTDLVIGRNAVRETLRHRAGRVKRLLFAGDDSERTGTVAEIFELAEAAGVPVEAVARDALSSRANSTSHQAVGLELKSRDFTDLKFFLQSIAAKQTATVLALDGIQDPHNVGALLRAAECFAVDAVLWSKNRGPTVTPAVTKVSVGASELVPLIQVSNLAQALASCRDAGFWTVVAADGDQASAPQEFDWPAKTILVLGAEGEGARSRTVRESDFQVFIPMYGQIDSLNVSQAGAVLLSCCANARSLKG